MNWSGPMTDPLRGVADATIVWAGVWCLIGWCAGLALGLSLRWRDGSRAEIRRLRMALEDSDRQLTQQFATADRMATMLAEQAGRPGGRAA
jgi:hypothetical protein